MIYMDNGATSWPKPQVVLDAVMRGLTELGANPGRGAYQMALGASMEIFRARQVIAEFFNAPNPQRLIFTGSTTEGLNYALYGLLAAGDHVLYSPLEHNASWRPLMTIAKARGVDVEMLEGDADGVVSPTELAAKIKPNTKMVVCCHASNITGTIQPVAELGAVAREHDLLFLVDAAQSAGILPIDVQAMQIDLLAAPGHKSLYGPMGTGILYVGDRAEAIRPLKQGGTGSKSHESSQPESFPDRLECGTLNLSGIAGLKAGVEWLTAQGKEKVFAELAAKTQYLLKGVSAIPGLSFYGKPAGEPRTTLVAVNVDGLSAGELAFRLDQEYGIAVRAGFHCAPLGHNLMGTAELGAVRLSLGMATTYQELDQVIAALTELAAEQAAGEQA